MGTETIASTNQNHKDIRQKILRYQGLFRSGNYDVPEFGIKLMKDGKVVTKVKTREPVVPLLQTVFGDDFSESCSTEMIIEKLSPLGLAYEYFGSVEVLKPEDCNIMNSSYPVNTPFNILPKQMISFDEPKKYKIR
jgi:hypothetical protein